MRVVVRRAIQSLAAVVVVGCSGADRLWPASGRVALTDGSPLAGGVIECRPADAAGPSARGEIDVDGGFTLHTAGRSGARPGRYRAVVLPPLVVGHGLHGPSVAARYGRFDTSDIEIRIPPGGTSSLTVVVESGR